MSDWIEGRVEHVVWAAEDGTYAIVRLLTEQERRITVVGSIAGVIGEGEGGFLAVEGKWEEHATHGRQFRATGALQGLPRTMLGLELYLSSSGIPGIGAVLAGRIVKAFGVQALRILSEEPERLAEVRGISAQRAAVIAERWQSDERGRAIRVLLRGLGLSMRLVERVIRRYGEQTMAVVRHDPFRLAEDVSGIGFRTADALARDQGLPADHPRRVEAAVQHVLEAQSREGHCFVPAGELQRLVADLDVPTEALERAISACEAAGRVVVDDDRIYLLRLYQAEVEVALSVRELRGDSQTLVDPAGEVERVAGWEEVNLDPVQADAVRAALRGGLVVITGGPGTGKTTLVRVLHRAARERGESWALASPTGRASRRLEEATGSSASTLHRLLEYRPGEGGFLRCSSNPLELDGLVVDEASMVDLPLLHALCGALPRGGERQPSLVLVGDADQLPSVGPGRVLRDLIDSDAVPVVRLEKIFRQAAQSGIVHAARSMLRGTLPVSGEHAAYDDLFLVARDDPDRARQTLLSIVAERLPAKGFDPIEQVQVLAPTRKGPLGTEVLNVELQARLNPDGAPVKRGGREFRLGDRVLCTRNRYDVEVFNGDVGRVVGAAPSGLVIDFDGHRVEWSYDDLDLLDLAYAMTVHKAQGSEYPAVVLALHRCHGIMLRRNLLYTAITRAKRFCCVVGDRWGWERAVERVGGDERWTALAERVGD